MAGKNIYNIGELVSIIKLNVVIFEFDSWKRRF